MKTLLSSFLLVAISAFSFGQSDPEAKSILDRLSQETSSKKNIEINFSYSIENPEKNIPKVVETGYLLISGDYYLINLMGMEQFFDGVKIYRVLHDDEAVEMMQADEDEEGLSPSKMLTMYQEGYKFRMLEEENIGSNSIQWIRLYPENASSVPYVHIDLAVNMDKIQMFKIIEQGKNGTITSYSIDSYKTDITLTGKEFKYSESRFPDYELIDLDF